MAGSRTPGPICSVSKPVEIDAGTTCRYVSPAPGPTGVGQTESRGSAVGLGVLSEVARGDFHVGESTWTGTIANVGVGLIPIVGQIADARDTAAAGVKVWEKPTSALAWTGLAMAVVGWIPLLGDAAKASTKVARKVTTNAAQTAEEVVAKAVPGGLGEQLIKEEKRSGLRVDVAAQEHRHKTDYRKGSGKDEQSAHVLNSSSVSDVAGYVRDRALTVLLPAKHHRAFDDYWKAWARQRLAKANPAEDVTITVTEWEKVLNSALASVPELRGRTGDTISFMIRTELYQTLGLRPDQLIRLPFSSVR